MKIRHTHSHSHYRLAHLAAVVAAFTSLTLSPLTWAGRSDVRTPTRQIPGIPPSLDRAQSKQTSRTSDSLRRPTTRHVVPLTVLAATCSKTKLADFKPIIPQRFNNPRIVSNNPNPGPAVPMRVIVNNTVKNWRPEWIPVEHVLTEIQNALASFGVNEISVSLQKHSYYHERDNKIAITVTGPQVRRTGETRINSVGVSEETITSQLYANGEIVVSKKSDQKTGKLGLAVSPNESRSDWNFTYFQPTRR